MLPEDTKNDLTQYPAASFSSSSSESRLKKKKWNPLRRFLKRSRKAPARYPSGTNQPAEMAPVTGPSGSNACVMSAQQKNFCSSESTDDSMFLELFTEDINEHEQSSNSIATGVFTEKSVYEFVWNYHEAFAKALEHGPNDIVAWETFWFGHHTPDYLFIRPSGNPLNLEGLVKQISKGELSNYEEDVIMVDSIKLLGEAAVIVYRSETRFLFQGSEVEDTRTNTIVLVWHDGKPKITSVQRSMGKDINAAS